MGRGPRQAREGRAGDQDRFAERDDDEQAAALGHVPAFDVPVRGARAAKSRHPEVERGRAGNPSPAPGPHREPRAAIGEAAGDPDRRRHAPPDRDAAEVAVVAGVVALERPQHEQGCARSACKANAAANAVRAPRTPWESTPTSRARRASGRTASPARGGFSGSSQLVTQVVSIHTHQTATISSAGLQRRRAASGDRAADARAA